jgi:ribonucleoside-diphosphate reductase alpha chain
LQKYIDQGISVNTSYNPENYEDHKVPMSEMIKHLVTFYKYGGKQLYYFNTFDGQGEINVDKMTADIKLEDDAAQSQEDCDSCVI